MRGTLFGANPRTDHMIPTTPIMERGKRGTEHRARVGVVLLAAGYGTRLASDMAACEAFRGLEAVPKPLLPLGGRVVLDHWLDALDALPCVGKVVVVTNRRYRPLYEEWARGKDIVVVDDGSTCNEKRCGAVQDIGIGLTALRTSGCEIALVVAGDTVLPGVRLWECMAQFERSEFELATFAYRLADMSDCCRRGMFQVCTGGGVGLGTASALVEKPATPKEAPSEFASAPVYMLRRALWDSTGEFIKEAKEKGADRDARDAPGFWLSWLVTRTPCALFDVGAGGRIDIGGLNHYKDALVDFAAVHGPDSVRGFTAKPRMPHEPAVGRAYPRIGLLGNPSDGYGGKTIAFALGSEGFAEVVATPSERFSVKHNPAHELPSEYDSLLNFADTAERYGIQYGARQLVLAGAVVFAKLFKELFEKKRSVTDGQANVDNGVGTEKSRSVCTISRIPNCELTYSTTIPTRRGLSGSSALSLATIRALARFHSTSLPDLNPDQTAWPRLLRTAELDVLGIACGLMDRVAQVYHGCMYMDFSGEENGVYEALDPRKLPELWCGYFADGTTECSGKTHGNLRKRFLEGDKEVRSTMLHLSTGTETCWKLMKSNGDMSDLPALMRRNFELRRKVVDVGTENMHLVSVANKAGFAAKMSGSGGAVICVPDPVRTLTESEILDAQKIFEEEGLVLHRVHCLPPYLWTS